jgi:hypothetical protein
MDGHVADQRRSPPQYRLRARQRPQPQIGDCPIWRRDPYLIDKAGLPPVRLHDLRHGAASLAHTAGADLKPSRTNSGTPASC